MTIDISKIKPGDKVTLVPLEVWATDDSGRFLYIKDDGVGACFYPDKIAAHHPAPREIGVGDRVVIIGTDYAGIVKAADGPQAWIRFEASGNRVTRELIDLTLVEGDHERA